jgi:hypothetical protein
MSEPHEEIEVFHKVSRVLSIAERSIFTVVALLLFVSAVALAWNGVLDVVPLFTGTAHSAIAETAEFLNLVLLILMIGEIAYTVTLSVRGVGLNAQPFLIVGLIAVIRRVLLLTVEEVQGNAQTINGIVSKSTVDLAILTLVVMAFVFAIYLLRKQDR